SGPPQLDVHGGGGAEHDDLRDAIHVLEAPYLLIFCDQRVSQRSHLQDSRVSVTQHTAELEALRAELAIDAPVIIGHSMGTFLAMSYLERHPHRVGGLVLLGSLVPATPRDEEELAISRRQEQAFAEWARAAQERQIATEGL